MPLDRNRDIHITGATGGDDSLPECDIAQESGVAGQADSGRKEALIDGGGGEGEARFHCLPVGWSVPTRGRCLLSELSRASEVDISVESSSSLE